MQRMLSRMLRALLPVACDVDRDAFDPSLFDVAGRALHALTRRYFRFQLRGVDNLPARPCLLVGNHSALGTAEILCLIGGWRQHLGLGRRVTGLMHDFFVQLPIIGDFYRPMGAVRASRDNALAAFGAGRDVLVYPGGDLDSCRPFYQPREVIFGDRRGYARLALEAGVPVVPLATIGSHWTMPMLPGGALLARLCGRRFRAGRMPLPAGVILAVVALVAALVGAVPWSLCALLVIVGLVPPPVRITTEIGEPIDVVAATAHLWSLEERIELAHQLVHGALQRTVSTMAH